MWQSIFSGRPVPTSHSARRRGPLEDGLISSIAARVGGEVFDSKFVRVMTELAGDAAPAIVYCEFFIYLVS